MALSDRNLALVGAVAALMFAAATPIARHRAMHPFVSPDDFVRAIADQRTPIIEMYLSEHLNPNARAAQDRPLLVSATLQKDWPTVHRLLDAGASVDLA